ncbi:MAG TPA: hypothetical protein VNA89_14300 [Gemmatimonadaceae bacterium]|nr:hypothetical protein [Gemmatimonadaceae bacterium]
MVRLFRSVHAMLAVAAIAVLTACGDPPAGPASLQAEPSLIIADAASGLGDPHFYWLPPTVPNNPVFSGVFAKKLSPKVTICEWDGFACGATVAHFTRTEGTGGQVIAENTKSPSYRVSWISSYCDAAGQCPIKSTKSYRMTVTVPGVAGVDLPLGYADIKVVNSLTEQMRVDRTQYVPLMPGRLLGIAFRIETGVVGMATQ